MERARQIWVDADACPNAIKEILYRAAQRVKVKLILVANAPLKIPPNQFIEQITVAKGFDVADSFIAQRVIAGDIVVTADIPLAADIVAKGGQAMSPRGERFTADNVRQRLQMRNALEELRSSGIHTGGPHPLTQRDRQLFANQLDSLLGKMVRSR